MTEEDKELLLKDLSARLPYGVNVEYTYKVKVIATNIEVTETKPLYLHSIETLDEMTISGIDDDGDNNICFLSEIKLYLFPLSSMTERQYKEWRDLEEEPLDEILRRNANGTKMTTLEHHLLVAKGMIDPIQWCYKNHFDVNGLIPLGLAKDASGLNIY